MNNRQLYKKTFSNLHAGHTLDLEGMKMKKHVSGPRCRRGLVVTVLILTMLFAMTCVGYAATDGKMFDNIKIWINGSQVATDDYVTNEDGSITIDLSEGDKISTQSEDGQTETDLDVGSMKGKYEISVENENGVTTPKSEVIIEEVTP